MNCSSLPHHHNSMLYSAFTSSCVWPAMVPAILAPNNSGLDLLNDRLDSRVNRANQAGFPMSKTVISTSMACANYSFWRLMKSTRMPLVPCFAFATLVAFSSSAGLEAIRSRFFA